MGSAMNGDEFGPARRRLLHVLAAFVVAALGLPGHAAFAKTPSDVLRLCNGDAAACRLFELSGERARQVDTMPSALFAQSDVLIVGEVHDNPLHHALQAKLVVQMARVRQGRTAVVMEHIRRDKSADLADFLARIDRRVPAYWTTAAAQLGDALRWKQSGWPAWAQFQPIAEAAIRAGIPILAGDVPRPEIMSVARKGLSVLSAADRTSYGLDTALPEKLREALLDELEASHCGLMPKSVFGKMADAQRLRDGHLARAAADAAKRHGSAVLLTGNGHARPDRGVAWYLRRLDPALRVRVILIAEAADLASFDPDKDSQAGFTGRAGGLMASYLVATVRHPREDPCIRMREQFGKKRKQ